MTVILVVSMIIVFLVIDFIYQKSQKKATVFAEEPKLAMNSSIARYDFNEIQLPQSVFFSKGHTWAQVRPSGNVHVGIDDFVSKFIGKINRISINSIGQEVKKGNHLFTIEQDGKKLSFNSPINGTIYSINDNVIENPKKITANPYDQSWFVTIKPKSLSLDLKLLKIADEASGWIKEEMNRLKHFIAGINVENSVVGATLHDGGEPIIGVMEYMDGKSWDKFQNEFLVV